jgi:hypothetical protein
MLPSFSFRLSLSFLFIAYCNALPRTQIQYYKFTNAGTGCFVSVRKSWVENVAFKSNQLFAGGNFLRNLTGAEMEELQSYQKAMNDYHTVSSKARSSTSWHTFSLNYAALSLGLFYCSESVPYHKNIFSSSSQWWRKASVRGNDI